MNPSTLIGMIGGLVVLTLAIYLNVDKPAELINTPGLLFVVGGTIAATFLSYPLKEVLRVFSIFHIVLRNERIYFEKDILEIERVARLSQKGSIREIESEIGRINNPFLRTGIQPVIDNTPEEDVTRLLNWRIARLKAKEAAEAQIFRTMASYAPAFGMVGTLLGLVNMLGDIGAGDIASMASNLALALLTTFYGLLLANMVFKPIAVKWERRTDKRIAVLSMVMEGIELLHQRRTPTFISETLKSFMMKFEDELHDHHSKAAVAKTVDDKVKK
ncbi:MAG: chemotaxis protein MotA [Pseudomonadales bacterium]|mgnify:FL=1|nr:chemotaxis protein MotA [Pseudomonadales bacterium]|tara:strand:- start:21381 stop:22202 length:822 start_codon:yes stop_codon:yes gene_type:complete